MQNRKEALINLKYFSLDLKGLLLQFKRVKAFWGVLAAMALGVWLASPLPTRAAGTSASSPSAHHKIVINLRIGWGRGIHAAIKAFEALHPNVRVNLAIYASGMGSQQLMTSIAGGSPPSLVVADRFTVGSWAQRGEFLPLNKFIAASQRRAKPGGTPGIYARNFYPACWKEATYRGKVYGIPISTDCRILFYNSDLLKRAGFVNKAGHAVPPKTWKQLEQYTVALTHRDSYGNLTQLGFSPYHSMSDLYIYALLNGGRFMNRAGTRVTMDSPPVVEALRFMAHLCKLIGGVNKSNVFLTAAVAPQLSPFLTGKVAMKIDIPGGLNTILNYKPYLRFGVAPPPTPSGKNPTTWSGGFAYCIPVGTKHARTVFKLVQFLVSPEGWRIQKAVNAHYTASMGQIYLPSMTAQPAVNREDFQKYIEHNPDMPPRVVKAMREFYKMMPLSHFRPVSPVDRYMWNQQRRAESNALRYGVPANVVLRRAARRVQRRLNRMLHPLPAPQVPWGWFVAAAAAVAVVLLALGALWTSRKGRYRQVFNSQTGAALFFVSPWLIGFLVFTIGPMAVSLVYSFCRYDVLHPARWVGLYNYYTIFFRHNRFWLSLANTAYMFISLPVGMVAGLAVALLMNAQVRGIKVYRTLFYLPTLVPAVANAVLWIWILNPSNGLVNSLLKLLGVHHPPLWLDSPSWFLGSKAAMILMGLWGAGGGMILWLAGLKGIQRQLYEAAEMDGAGVFRRFIHITLPMLSPYIFFNLIMGVIGTLQGGFVSSWIMTGGGPANSTVFFGYYLFVEAFRYFRMGYASALAWILLVMCVILSAIQFVLSKKWVTYDTV